MLAKDFVGRLTHVQNTVKRFVPPDLPIRGFSVGNDSGQFTVEVSMGDSYDTALKYRDILATALTDAKISYTLGELGRRRDDPEGAFVFTSLDFVITIRDFSQWAHMLSATPGPADSEDPEIEAFMAEQEAEMKPLGSE